MMIEIGREQAEIELQQVLWEVSKTDQKKSLEILYFFIYFSFNYRRNMWKILIQKCIFSLVPHPKSFV